MTKTKAKGPSGKRKARPRDQESIAFDYYFILKEIIKDLIHIDMQIPKETSRYEYGAFKAKDTEAMCIIMHRKVNLLNYIQTICRDHIHYGQRLLDGGWKPEHNFVARGPRKAKERG